MFCPFYSIFFDSIHNGFEIIVPVDVSLSPVFRTILFVCLFVCFLVTESRPMFVAKP